MIRIPTVFVLGAGANCSYGFPSGEQLKDNIVRVVDGSLVASAPEPFSFMARYGSASVDVVQSHVCRHFSQALKNSGQPSIDAFLNANSHKPGFHQIGKGAIAKVLLQSAKKAKPIDADDNWLKYLFEVMLEGVSSPEEFIENNKISFITFNYDRFLEKWLHERIQHSFGISESDALDVLKNIPLVHVYGALGEYPPSEKEVAHPYPWIIAAESIRTIFESINESEELQQAKELLLSNNRVCLLGFGFHKENIELLGLHTLAKQKIYATRYKLYDAEWERLTAVFGTNPRPVKGGFEDKSTMLLRTVEIL